MPSKAVLDIDALVAPIAGDNPAGSPPPYTLEQELNADRKSEPDAEPPKIPEWIKIVRTTTDVLTNKSKDFGIATRLVEAVSNTQRFAGLRDSFILLRRMIEECWDRMYPVPEEGEGFEIRGKKLDWLNDISSGARFPATVMALPIVVERDMPEFTHHDLTGPGRADLLAQLQGLSPRQAQKFSEALLRNRDDIKEAQEELVKLAAVVEEKVPGEKDEDTGREDKINLLTGGNRLGHALNEVAVTVADLVKKLNLEPEASGGEAGGGEGVGAEEAGDGEAVGGGGIRISANAGASRAQLYQQLEVISNALQRLEPHSPVPYLIKRAVKMGSLDFPMLMRSMIEETGILDQIDKLLGIAPPAEQSSSY